MANTGMDTPTDCPRTEINHDPLLTEKDTCAYQRGGKLGSQAACLIRDTMKVTGISGQLSPPVAALFFVDPADPEAGGTGHTIRVCHHAGVPVIFQDHWATWLATLPKTASDA